jgi:thiosulfate/3-mercaptopyruvate sulfurtransferase
MTATATTPTVDLDWVEAHLADDGVRLIEVDVTAAPYREGHIPGALLWNVYADLRHPDYSPATTSELGDLLARSGLDPETTAVFYGYAAHLGYWLMRSLGHDRALLLDGPRERWLESGRAFSEAVPEPVPAEARALRSEPSIAATYEDVLALAGSPDAVILDVRSQAEFDGVNFWPSGAPEEVGRPGRIPGAAHLPIELLRAKDGRFRSTTELTGALAAAGVAPDRRVVTYCTVGNRAAMAWFALTYLLDRPDAAVYAGSWAEWGFRL